MSLDDSDRRETSPQYNLATLLYAHQVGIGTSLVSCVPSLVSGGAAAHLTVECPAHLLPREHLKANCGLSCVLHRNGR